MRVSAVRKRSNQGSGTPTTATQEHRSTAGLTNTYDAVGTQVAATQENYTLAGAAIAKLEDLAVAE